jgi:assimilatory nitrate reductase catalytic subunit
MPWHLLAVAWLPESTVLAARTELQALMCEFSFASCVPFSDGSPVAGAAERSGLLFRAAHHHPVADTVLEDIEALLQLQGPDTLRYLDKKRGQRRAVRLIESDTQTSLNGFLLAGDTSAQGWITTLLKESLPAHIYGRALLVPGATPPVPVVSRGTQVCTCFNVTDTAIQSHLKTCTGAPSGWLASLQATLKCGTNCGSCLPQLQRMVRNTLEPQATAS